MTFVGEPRILAKEVIRSILACCDVLQWFRYNRKVLQSAGHWWTEDQIDRIREISSSHTYWKKWGCYTENQNIVLSYRLFGIGNSLCLCSGYSSCDGSIPPVLVIAWPVADHPYLHSIHIHPIHLHPHLLHKTNERTNWWWIARD